MLDEVHTAFWNRVKASLPPYQHDPRDNTRNNGFENHLHGKQTKPAVQAALHPLLRQKSPLHHHHTFKEDIAVLAGSHSQ